MAKLKNPLLGTSAWGSFGPRLTYSERESGSQMRFQRAQKDRITAARTEQRSFFFTAVSWWHELTPTEQGEWHKEGIADC